MLKDSFAFSKVRSGLLLLLILSVVFSAFSPVLDNGFVFWDDDVHLYENITVRYLDFEHIRDMFTGLVNKIYIPLTTFSFAVEHHFFKYDPFIYHLDNLLLHLAVVGFVFWLGLRLGLSMIASGAAALLFGLHPMHVESVAWVTERKDVLYSFFYMASLLSYSRYLDFTKSTPTIQKKKQYRFLVLTCVFGILSMLAKPMALSLPLILLLLDWFHGRGWSRDVFIEKIPVALLIAAITLPSYAQHARLPGHSITEGFLICVWTFIFYIRQFLFPTPLVPHYRLSMPIVFGRFEYFMPIIVLALLIALVIRCRRHRWLMFAAAYYLFSIFFLMRYDNVKDSNIVADRFMYLPSLGICFLFGYGFQKVLDLKKRAVTAAAAVLVTAVFVGAGLWTHAQSLVWRDSFSLWRHELKYYPDDTTGLNNLAAALREEEEYKKAEDVYRSAYFLQARQPSTELSREAVLNIQKVNYIISLYSRAIQSESYFIDSHYNLGKLFADIGRYPEAIESYKQALWLDHTFKDVHFSLGELYDTLGDYEQAVYAFEQTIKLNPDNEDVYMEVASALIKTLKNRPGVEIYEKTLEKTINDLTELIKNGPQRATSYFNLGFLYSEIPDYTRAISAYQMALDINPNHGNTLYNLGNVYRDQGQLSDALAMYKKCIDAGSRRSDAYLNLGAIYERQGKSGLAKESFELAVKFDPYNARAYFNLGYMEERIGNLEKAIKLYQKSADLDAENEKALYNLGNSYAKLNKNQEAIAAYLKAVGINSDYMDAWVNLSTISFKEGDFKNAVKYCDEAVLLGYKAPAGYLDALAPYK